MERNFLSYYFMYIYDYISNDVEWLLNLGYCKIRLRQYEKYIEGCEDTVFVCITIEDCVKDSYLKTKVHKGLMKLLVEYCEQFGVVQGKDGGPFIY